MIDCSFETDACPLDALSRSGFIKWNTLINGVQARVLYSVSDVQLAM